MNVNKIIRRITILSIFCDYANMIQANISLQDQEGLRGSPQQVYHTAVGPYFGP